MSAIDVLSALTAAPSTSGGSKALGQTESAAADFAGLLDEQTTKQTDAATDKTASPSDVAKDGEPTIVSKPTTLKSEPDPKAMEIVPPSDVAPFPPFGKILVQSVTTFNLQPDDTASTPEPPAQGVPGATDAFTLVQGLEFAAAVVAPVELAAVRVETPAVERQSAGLASVGVLAASTPTDPRIENASVAGPVGAPASETPALEAPASKAPASETPASGPAPAAVQSAVPSLIAASAPAPVASLARTAQDAIQTALALPAEAMDDAPPPPAIQATIDALTRAGLAPRPLTPAPKGEAVPIRGRGAETNAEHASAPEDAIATSPAPATAPRSSPAPTLTSPSGIAPFETAANTAALVEPALLEDASTEVSSTAALPGEDSLALDHGPALAIREAPSGLSRATLETTAQIAAQIHRRLEGRFTRFELALTPEGLGRVDVSLDINADGQLSARLAFDNPLAATELRGRADELRRQLQEAGFQLSGDALDFSQRDPSSGEGFDRRSSRAFAGAHRLNDETDAAATPPTRWLSLTLSPEGVDMKV